MDARSFNWLAILRRLGLAVVAQLFVNAEIRPLAARRPVTHETQLCGDLHEPRIGTHVRKARPEQNLTRYIRFEPGIAQECKDFVRPSEHSGREQIMVTELGLSMLGLPRY